MRYPTDVEIRGGWVVYVGLVRQGGNPNPLIFRDIFGGVRPNRNSGLDVIITFKNKCAL